MLRINDKDLNNAEQFTHPKSASDAKLCIEFDPKVQSCVSFFTPCLNPGL